VWEVEYTDEFGDWWNLLDEQERDLMTRNFRELEAKMRPEAQARVKARAREAMAEMLLSQIRQAAGLTQEEVASRLGIKQPTLSRIESQGDMQLSTLQRLVGALGGELEIIAHLPGRDVRIRQFTEAQ
jgi:DNA-binding XRE family transcriptional regulator